MELLRCFSPLQPVLGNKDIAQALQLPPATVSRLVYTLTMMGYLAQDQDSGKYRLGSGVLSLGFPLLEMFSVRQRARSGMMELAQALGGSVAIAIRSRLEMVCIEVVRGGDRIGHPIDVGLSYPMCNSAMGRAYLASCSPTERASLTNQLRIKQPHSWAAHQDQVEKNLSNYAKLGCCVSVGEIYPDVQAVAVPLGRIDRGEFAVINCSFQKRKLDESWLIQKVGPRLITLARQIN